MYMFIGLPKPTRLGDPRGLFDRISGIGRLFAIGLVVVVSAHVALVTQRAQAASATSGAESRLAPVQFAPATGWHLLTGTVHACPGVRAARCSQVTSQASTTRWRDCVECLPHRTLAAMPRNGIAIQITVAIEHPPRAAHTFAWPPHVSRTKIHLGFEGLPGRIGVYQDLSRIGMREVSLFVFFGRPSPTARQIRRANTELRHARLA